MFVSCFENTGNILDNIDSLFFFLQSNPRTLNFVIALDVIIFNSFPTCHIRRQLEKVM